MLRGFSKHSSFCVDIRSVLIPIITSPTLPTHSLWSYSFYWKKKQEKKAQFYYVFALFPICMSCSTLHVIKVGFWQSYHWPTAVITKGLHSCLWLTRLGNVITKVCLIGGAQGASCEACVFAQAIPATLGSYPNRVLGHETRCTARGRE